MAVGNPITELSTTGNFVPVTRTLTINGVSYDLSADRSWSIASPGGGSVTSVAMTVPTGFSVSGSPITSAGTLAVTFASGYALPTTVKQSNWDDAYTFVSNFPSQTGNNGKFLYTSGSVLSWQTALQNPMTALGDMLFGGVSGAVTVLPGNQFTTRAYLQQVGTGSGSAAPTWGGIVSTDISGQAITRVNDTNVTLTLTGTPGNSVLNAVGLTMGWTGELSAGRGGTGTSGVSGIMLGNLTAPVTGITGIGGQILRANPSTGVYEFWTPNYLESPFTQLGQIIYSGAGGQPLALNANSTGNNMYLRSISSGTPAWASIQGGDIVGAGLTSTNDTNVQITLGGTPNNSLLRSVSLTMGWTGQLAVPRGGTGVSTITGVVIGNGTGVMTGVAGTAGQLIRRDATNSFYEFFTPTYLSNPMTSLGDIIYGNAAGAPVRLAANSSGSNQYLRSVSSGAPGWASIAGSDITGAAITTANDTNILITASGNTTSALLRTLTLTAGWTGSLAVGRGGTGAATLTGVLIGNGTSAVTGITGTASQLLRRNAGNTAYEFFTPNFTTGSGTTNFVPIWSSSTVLANSPLSITGSEANFGNNKLVAGNTSAPNGSIMLQDNYSNGHFGNVGTMFSGGNFMLGYGVTPSTSSSTAFLSSVFISGVPLTRYANVLGTDVVWYAGAAQSVAIGSSVTMSERMRLTNTGTLQITTGNLQLNTATYLTWGGAYGTDIPTISGTSGSGSNGFLQFYPAGSTSGVKMALRRTGQLSIPSYTSSSAFTGTSVATLAVTNAGDVITIAPQQVTASGTYTPTWTGLANVTSVTAFSCQYMRVGDTVTVSGWVTIDPVSDNTPTSLSFSLPINSDVSVVNRLNGTGVTQGGGAAASMSGYSVNFGEFEVIPSLATAVNYAFHFTYRIV
jgi:hypothetical protein